MSIQGPISSFSVTAAGSNQSIYAGPARILGIYYMNALLLARLYYTMMQLRYLKYKYQMVLQQKIQIILNFQAMELELIQV